MEQIVTRYDLRTNNCHHHVQAVLKLLGAR